MPVLTVLIVIPLITAAVVLLINARHVRAIQGIAITSAAFCLVLSWSMILRFDPEKTGLQFAEHHVWIRELAMSYSLGVDGLSLPMVLLTTLVGLVAMVASLGMRERVKGYFACFLVMESAVTGVFVAQDWLLFYAWWEVSVIPMFFLIGVWGAKNRAVAALRYFLYTLAGSVFMLLGILVVYETSDPHTFSMQALVAESERWSKGFQIAPFVAFFAAFAVKIPAFPMHGWLPSAHVEAPTPVSMMLSAVLLKMGAYGLLRLSALLPLGLEWFTPALLALGLVNIIYGALLAWRQTDLKAMVAFSSISHMGFVMIGIAALNSAGFEGAVLQMISHGLIAAALFLLVGVIYDRAHTRHVTDFGGLAMRVPVYSGLMALSLLASMGMPGLAQFISEFHVLAGAFERWGLYVLFASFGMLVTTAYCLRAIGRMFMGPFNGRWRGLRDMGPRELLAAAPLAVLIVVLGFLPGIALDLTGPTVSQLVSPFS